MTVTAGANRLCDATLALVYPQACHVCGASVESRFDGVVCSFCWSKSRLFLPGEVLCWKCGAPASATHSGAYEDLRCHRCEDLTFTAARACGGYEGALRASIIALKQKPHICRRIGLLMKGLCATAPLNRATRVLPVPLHADREKERGFNQAVVLAEVVGDLLGLPVMREGLTRTTHTERHRAGMDARARRESVESAFYVSQPKLVAGESILLVDDVLTTGATVSACAASLRSAGALDVFVLTLARPLLP